MPAWLNTANILSTFSKKDKQHAYRREVQNYAVEEPNIWKELKHGLIMGSNDFVEQIRCRYLTQAPHKEIPQQRSLSVVKDARSLLGEAILSIARKDKTQRDLLIYALWEKGWYTNQDIGSIFGISYSAVSRRVTIAKDKIIKNTTYKKRYRQLKSQLSL
jgi:hypothetical protein